MVRQDDASISDKVFLLRRIPPWADRVTWDDGGNPLASTMNFDDPKQEMSVCIEHETTPDEVLDGHPDFGLLRFSTQVARGLCGTAIRICRDPPPPSHVLICGKLTRSMRKKLRDSATWVKFPTRL